MTTIKIQPNNMSGTHSLTHLPEQIGEMHGVAYYEGLKKKVQVEELVEHGILMQINASTLTGDMGWSVKHYVLKLMKEGLIHLIGTDAHSINRRRPEIKEALGVIDRKIGKEYRELITETNPKKVLRGEKLSGKARI